MHEEENGVKFTHKTLFLSEFIVQKGEGRPFLDMRVVWMDQIVKGSDQFVHDGVQYQ
jgi:hypothetical protein